MSALYCKYKNPLLTTRHSNLKYISTKSYNFSIDRNRVPITKSILSYTNSQYYTYNIYKNTTRSQTVKKYYLEELQYQKKPRAIRKNKILYRKEIYRL